MTAELPSRKDAEIVIPLIPSRWIGGRATHISTPRLLFEGLSQLTKEERDCKLVKLFLEIKGTPATGGEIRHGDDKTEPDVMFSHDSMTTGIELTEFSKGQMRRFLAFEDRIQKMLLSALSGVPCDLSEVHIEITLKTEIRKKTEGDLIKAIVGALKTRAGAADFDMKKPTFLECPFRHEALTLLPKYGALAKVALSCPVGRTMPGKKEHEPKIVVKYEKDIWFRRGDLLKICTRILKEKDIAFGGHMVELNKKVLIIHDAPDFEISMRTLPEIKECFLSLLKEKSWNFDEAYLFMSTGEVHRIYGN